jgi:hypothetical protein
MMAVDLARARAEGYSSRTSIATASVVGKLLGYDLRSMQEMQLTSTVAGLRGWHRMRQRASGIQRTRPKRKEEAEEVKKKKQASLSKTEKESSSED